MDRGGSARTSASCSGTGASRPPTWPSGSCYTSVPSRPAWAPCCITVDAVIVLERHDQLDLDDYRRVVHDHEPVEIDPALLRRVGERRRALDEHLAAGGVAYGVTTRVGYLARSPVAAEDRLSLQRAILVGRGVGGGGPLPQGVVRGALLLRLV